MSVPKRFFCENIDYPKVTEAVLEGDEFTHAKTVLRVEEGSEIVLLDGRGGEFPAIVAKMEKHRLTVHITGAIADNREPKAKIYLLCGALKGDKTELVVQKATELGVSRIGVFASEYCSAYMNENKIERLRKVAREAAKQCLRACAPDVEYFADFRSALNSADGYENKLFACEFITEGGDVSQIRGSTALVVGSEGGFSEREYDLATELGYTGITLGRRILRAETAAIALTSLAAFALGELR